MVLQFLFSSLGHVQLVAEILVPTTAAVARKQIFAHQPCKEYHDKKDGARYKFAVFGKRLDRFETAYKAASFCASHRIKRNGVDDFSVVENGNVAHKGSLCDGGF